MDHRQVVGRHFEDIVSEIFRLRISDIKSLGNVPDLMSRDDSFYVEVKASAYNNGGVIKGEQLSRFNKEINAKRFYAFCYHSLKNMERDYKTKKSLIKALDLKSLYMFPFSIVKSFYDNSKKRHVTGHFNFVSLNERTAERIFRKDEGEWNKLRLNLEDYCFFEKDKLHVLTRKNSQLQLLAHLL